MFTLFLLFSQKSGFAEAAPNDRATESDRLAVPAGLSNGLPSPGHNNSDAEGGVSMAWAAITSSICGVSPRLVRSGRDRSREVELSHSLSPPLPRFVSKGLPNIAGTTPTRSSRIRVAYHTSRVCAPFVQLPTQRCWRSDCSPAVQRLPGPSAPAIAFRLRHPLRRSWPSLPVQ